MDRVVVSPVETFDVSYAESPGIAFASARVSADAPAFSDPVIAPDERPSRPPRREVAARLSVALRDKRRSSKAEVACQVGRRGGDYWGMTDQDLRSADLQLIVSWIYDDWDGVNPSAASYLNALDVHDCQELDDPVGNETAEVQLRYFLTHAAGWRGPRARAIKAELRHRLGLER